MRRLTRVAPAIAVMMLLAGCGGRAVPAATPPAERALPTEDLQKLFEAGRYEEVVTRVRTNPLAPPPQRFLAGQSLARLGRTPEAAVEFTSLEQQPEGSAWRAVGELATVVVRGEAPPPERIEALAAAYRDHPFVQYGAGQSHAIRGNYAAAAAAFDRCAEQDPAFAYAYYYAGLAYSRIQRPDLMAQRFETFLKLAPDAPERPEVESILRTLRQ